MSSPETTTIPSLPPPPGKRACGRRRGLDVLLAVVLVLAPLVLPGPFLQRAQGLFGGDRSEYHLPYMTYEHDALHAGEIPFWNPYVYGGVPEFGNPERAPMYPPHLLGLLLLSPTAMLNAKYLFHLALAGVGLYVLLRMLAVGPLLALLAGLTIEWSGCALTRIALPNVGDSAAWAPLMLALNVWFGRRPGVGRGLAYSAAGGCMLLLFFPQITLTTVLVLALFGAGRFVRWRGARRERRFSPAWWMGRVALPAAELAAVLAMLRYPAHPYRFPENMSGNVSGLGMAGALAIGAAVALWMAWLVARGARIGLDVRGLWRWAWRFGLVWAAAGAFAAPQLAITGEMIPLSNQQHLRYEARDFFTGAQAYGCVQEFVLQSALASGHAQTVPKESVNNMALGPGVWLLALGGVAVGLHRRRRVGWLLGAGIVVAATVYMGSAPVLEVVRRLPFFGKFAGLSRYQAFLSLFLIVWAVLSAEALVRRARRGTARRAAMAVAALLLAANLACLVRHANAYFEHLMPGGVSWTMPAPVVDSVTRRLAVGERMNLDVREAVRTEEFYYPMLMTPMAQHWPSLATIGPMRLATYDRWLHDHNAWLGVVHDDYRASFWEPAPSPWMRALRVRWYLYPPGFGPPGMDRMDDTDGMDRMDQADAAGAGAGNGGVVLGEAEGTEAGGGGAALRQVDDVAGWGLFEDRGIAPEAWPAAEADLAGPPPSRYAAPAGWGAALEEFSHSRVLYSVTNPGAPAWMVVPQPYYPGWRAFAMTGEELAVRPAYGFLTAVRAPEGRSAVELRYCPLSFTLGWVGFLWAVWVWWAVAVAGGEGCDGFPAEAGTTNVEEFPAEAGTTNVEEFPAEAGTTNVRGFPAKAGTTNVEEFPAEAGTTNVRGFPAKAGTTNVGGFPAEAGTTYAKDRWTKCDRTGLTQVLAPSGIVGLVVVLVLAQAHRLFDTVPDSLVLRTVEVGAIVIFAPLVTWNIRRWRENRAAYQAWRREKREGSDQ